MDNRLLLPDRGRLNKQSGSYQDYDKNEKQAEP
jgi:hypothetical protein